MYVKKLSNKHLRNSRSKVLTVVDVKDKVISSGYCLNAVLTTWFHSGGKVEKLMVDFYI